MERIVICAALPVEIRSFCRRFGFSAPSRQRQIVLNRFNDRIDVTIVVSGIGRDRMARLLAATSGEPATCWISAGFSGALTDGLNVGDCVKSTQVITTNGEVIHPSSPRWIDENEFSATLLCADEIVSSFEEKQALHNRYGATAIDMESAAVAQHALNRRESFVGIRMISDDGRETLPIEFSQVFDSAGFPCIPAAIRLMMRNPFLIPEFCRMGMRSFRLSARLADAVGDFLSSIP